MKKSELEIGKVYAYSTKQNPDRLWEISAFKIVDLDPQISWRETKGTVAGHYVDRNGEVGTTLVKVLPRFIIGDYQEWKHSLEIRQKNREIAELKRTIEVKRVHDKIAQHKDIFIEKYQVQSYKISNGYDGKVKIELTADQFNDIAYDLKRYKTILDREEAQRQAEYEARQADRNIIKEEQVA